MSPDPLLSARSLGRRQPHSEDWLLRGVDLSVGAGERISLVGPTGSGKTLLLRALVGLDPLDEGEVRWRGETVHGSAVPQFRRSVIYLPQHPVLVEGDVEANLALPFTFAANRRRTREPNWIESSLDRTGRGASFLRRPAGELSGGERQIVALLRALQLEPPLLLLDEPTASLDTASTEQIEQLIGEWFAEAPGERAYIWISHDDRQARRQADRHLTMHSGGRLERHGGGADA